MSRQERIFDREVRNQKRREQLLKIALDGMKQAEKIHQKAKDALNDVPSPDELLNQVLRNFLYFFIKFIYLNTISTKFYRENI